MKSLGDRIKNYESAYDTYMPFRLPVIVRVDGKGFSKLTKKIKAAKPFDEVFCSAMAQTMLSTADNIEGCIFAYTQSDEITFVLKNDQSNNSTPWFGNRVQKISSVVASMATANFNTQMPDDTLIGYFDGRVFVVPSWQECINMLIWRQNDATKNSISASCYYESAKIIGKKTARKKMHGLNQKAQQDMLFKETGINWNNYPIKYKRGTCCYKISQEITLNGNTFERSSWKLDENMPVFTQDQEFLKNIFNLVGKE